MQNNQNFLVNTQDVYGFVPAQTQDISNNGGEGAVLEAIRSLTQQVQLLRHELAAERSQNANNLKRMTEEVMALRHEVRGRNGTASELETKFDNLPCTSVAEVLSLNKDLNTYCNYVKEFKKLLLRVGGFDGASFLRNAMKKIFTEDVSAQFTWKGTKEKPSAEKLYAVKMIKDVCHLKFKAEDNSMNTVLQKHFLYAKDRITKKMRAQDNVNRGTTETTEA